MGKGERERERGKGKGEKRVDDALYSAQWVCVQVHMI